MGEKYIFKWANDSINEVFKPLWLNDTTYHLPNHINAEVSWYETLDLSNKNFTNIISNFYFNILRWFYYIRIYKTA